MAISDRLRRMEQAGELNTRQTGESGTSLVLADPPIITRANQLLHGLLGKFKESGGSYARYVWMIEAFANEGIEEMRDAVQSNGDAETLMCQWFLELSMLFEWIATGDVRGDLPDWLAVKTKELTDGASE